MEEIVDVGEAEPEWAHKGAAVLVVALADGGERGVGGLPEPFGEREGVEALRRRSNVDPVSSAPLYLRAQTSWSVGLDDGVEVPAVGGEHIEGVK